MHDDHDHNDDHDHDHDHAHGDPHAPRRDHDAGPATPYEVLERAMRELLIEKGVFTAQEIAAQIDLMDSRSPSLGAKVIAKAWTDPAFKAALIADTRGALAQLDIDIGQLAEFRVIENHPGVHNVDVLVGTQRGLTAEDVVQVLRHCLAGDGDAVAVQQAGVEQQLHHRRDAAGAVQVDGQVAAAGLQVAQHRHLAAHT